MKLRQQPNGGGIVIAMMIGILGWIIVTMVAITINWIVWPFMTQLVTQIVEIVGEYLKGTN